MTLTLQPTKQNDMVANNNTHGVSKSKHTTDKDKNKQVHSQIKIHLKNITKIEKDKKLNMTEHKADMNITEKLSSTFAKENQTEHTCTLFNQTIKIYKSNKGVPKAIPEFLNS